MFFTGSSRPCRIVSSDTTKGDIMKRVVPILLALLVLAGAKKKAMGSQHHSHDERRRRFEERARAWHQAEHDAWHKTDSGDEQATEKEASAD